MWQSEYKDLIVVGRLMKTKLEGTISASGKDWDLDVLKAANPSWDRLDTILSQIPLERGESIFEIPLAEAIEEMKLLHAWILSVKDEELRIAPLVVQSLPNTLWVCGETKDIPLQRRLQYLIFREPVDEVRVAQMSDSEVLEDILSGLYMQLEYGAFYDEIDEPRLSGIISAAGKDWDLDTIRRGLEDTAQEYVVVRVWRDLVLSEEEDIFPNIAQSLPEKILTSYSEFDVEYARMQLAIVLGESRSEITDSMVLSVMYAELNQGMQK
jgi:hypothetical protein